MNLKKLAMLLTVLLLFSACGQNDDTEPSPSSASESVAISHEASETSQPEESTDGATLSPDELQEKYIAPLGLTTVIGQPWSSPAELDPDSVLVTLEIKLIEEDAMDQYEQEGDLHLSQEFAEEYANQYFGMTPEQLRKSRDYDSESQSYIVPIGLGGAWGVRATGSRQNGDQLEVQYELIDSWEIVGADGILEIALHSDGSYTYLSNTVHERIYSILQFPAARTLEVSEGKATMNSGGQMSTGPDEDHMVSYDGEDLANIILFYETTLEEIGASGEVDTTKYTDGWAWTGTYEDGKPLSIDIQPDEASEEYVITILF